MMINIYRVRMKQPNIPREVRVESIWFYSEMKNPEEAIMAYLRGAEDVGMPVEMSIDFIANSKDLFDVERLEVVAKIQ